jgi:hypothetical protein
MTFARTRPHVKAHLIIVCVIAHTVVVPVRLSGGAPRAGDAGPNLRDWRRSGHPRLHAPSVWTLIEG